MENPCAGWCRLARHPVATSRGEHGEVGFRMLRKFTMPRVAAPMVAETAEVARTAPTSTTVSGHPLLAGFHRNGAERRHDDRLNLFSPAAARGSVFAGTLLQGVEGTDCSTAIEPRYWEFR
jgi:hypothetical protein